MHTYRRVSQGEGNYLYVVGFEVANPECSDFRSMKDCATEDEAAAYVSYLNGGDHPKKPWPGATV